MGTSKDWPAWLVESEPQIPLATLVEVVNQMYHSVDAARYDQEHPEINEILPAIWEQMLAFVPRNLPLRVLDFGCGTGFEANAVISHVKNIEKIVCYDPSPQMLAHCEQRLRGQRGVVYCTRLEEVWPHGPFDVLLTNSVLHHLPSIQDMLQTMKLNLTSSAIWLSGHEPSSRYFKNSECRRFFDEYTRRRSWAKYFVPKLYVSKFTEFLSGSNSLQKTAVAAFEHGLFKKMPSTTMIDRLVDFHVPHSMADLEEGRGLDFRLMEEQVGKEWQLMWFTTYSYLGPYKTHTVPRKWLLRSNVIAERFPEDGANFCSVWSNICDRSPNIAELK